MSTPNVQLNNCCVVYVSAFDGSVVVDNVTPTLRNNYIQQCDNEHIKRQRYCVWRLLDYALRQQLGFGVDSFEFTLDASGKWRSNCGVQFSLSHCSSAVAVALSNNAVGVDIEYALRQIDHKLAGRILSDGELAIYNALPIEKRNNYLLETWCSKESIYKQSCETRSFEANSIVVGQGVRISHVKVRNGCYVVAVATEKELDVSTKVVDLFDTLH